MAAPCLCRPQRDSWPDATGGWLIAGEETFADGTRHNSVWAVDAAGTTGTRLGCNPKAERGSVFSTVSTADAVYAIVNHYERESDGFQGLVVRIDRTPPAPSGS